MARDKKRKSLQERFWEKVDKTETCWLWTAGTTNYGYGVISEGGHQGKVLRSHVLSYEWFCGETNGLWVLHTCDTPACVNPKHLYLGTPKNNADDRESRKRSQTGDNHWTRRKL